VDDAVMVWLVAALGLLVGSFANVVIHRVPKRESIVSPGSRCPGCGASLRWFENLPVLSYLAQRGRCRHCGMHISLRYPAVELLTAGLFALAAATLPRATDLIAYLPFIWVLVVLSFIDLDHKLLPDRIVFPASGAFIVLFGIAAVLGPGIGTWPRSLATGLAALGALLVVHLISPAGMAFGDVKFSFMLGMALGYLDRGWPRVMAGFLMAFILGSVVGVGLMIVGKAGRKTQIPFGPFLAAGALIGIFWGDALLRWWLG
jgi:leader peptidase (prepilin peptidase) / N-methyltransferase